jgi:Bacterial extracellular solute-binding proteins, family 3
MGARMPRSGGAAARHAVPGSTATLDRVKETGKLTLGYRADARPFSYRNESGKADGYSVALCERITDQVRTELGLYALVVEWVPITIEDRFVAVQQGKMDRTATATFTSPDLPERNPGDSPSRLFRCAARSTFRCAAAIATDLVWFTCADHPRVKNLLLRRGHDGRELVGGAANTFQLTAKVVPVRSYEAGIRQVTDRGSDVLLGDRPILLDAASACLFPTGNANDFRSRSRIP